MSKSSKLFEAAKQIIPGGVNSPVRAFKAVGGTPLFIESAKGAYITDADGKRYIDYVQSWGPMIAGHANDAVLAAIHNVIEGGLSFGAPTELEVTLAQRITDIVPSIESLRMVNSGTEATMSAIRLARAYTERDVLVKFEGCYHGHSDALLVKAGSGALTFGNPSSPGVPNAVTRDTLVLEYNSITSIESAFAERGNDIACVIVEPVAGNMNCIPPRAAFLQRLRELCSEYGSVLIFDEVMTGFRVALGGAQAHYNIEPDLTTLGKVIGGGMPVGAFGGKRDIMEMLAPQGPVYQAGTLSGNPVAMTAGLATLDIITQAGFYEPIMTATKKLADGLADAAKRCGIPLTCNHAGTMFGFFFTGEDKVENYQQVMACNGERFNQFFHRMLDAGVYLAPAAYEAGFVSAAHNDEIIEETLAIAERVMQTLD